MPHLAPFMCRRARLIRGVTQEKFAEEMGVDPGTVSRWESGKLTPTPKAFTRIRLICRKADPCYSPEYFEQSPTYKVLVMTDNFHKPVIATKGLLAKVGMTAKEYFERKPRSGVEDWGKIEQVCLNDPRWLRGDIAFFEAVGYSYLDDCWWYVIGAPLAEGNCTLVEGIPDPKHVEHTFWVKLYPFNDPPR